MSTMLEKALAEATEIAMKMSLIGCERVVPPTEFESVLPA